MKGLQAFQNCQNFQPKISFFIDLSNQCFFAMAAVAFIFKSLGKAKNDFASSKDLCIFDMSLEQKCLFPTSPHIFTSLFSQKSILYPNSSIFFSFSFQLSWPNCSSSVFCCLLVYLVVILIEIKSMYF